jgi:TonB family protein
MFVIDLEFRGETNRSYVSVRNMRPSKMIIAAALAVLNVAAANLPAENLPEMRPALIGSGPRSLVNLINTEELFRKGQRDAWVMFNCVILDDGLVSRYDLPTALRKSEGADALKKEVAKALTATRFIPAVYGHRPTWARFRGTVIFAVVNGKPHLRIFANQEIDELKRGADFVAPQLVYKQGASFGPYSPGHAAYMGIQGTVKVRHSMDAQGKTTDVQVLGESHAGEGLGQAAREGILASVYVPAYRNGKPVASTLTYDEQFLPGR